MSAGHAFDGDGNMDDQTDFGGICEVGFLAIMEVFEIFGRRRFADEAAHGFAVVFFTARKDDAVALLLQNG